MELAGVVADEEGAIYTTPAVAPLPLAVTPRSKVTASVRTRNLFDETHIYRRSNANAVPVRNFNGATFLSTSYGGILGDYGNLNPPRTWAWRSRRNSSPRRHRTRVCGGRTV